MANHFFDTGGNGFPQISAAAMGRDISLTRARATKLYFECMCCVLRPLGQAERTQSEDLWAARIAMLTRASN